MIHAVLCRKTIPEKRDRVISIVFLSKNAAQHALSTGYISYVAHVAAKPVIYE